MRPAQVFDRHHVYWKNLFGMAPDYFPADNGKIYTDSHTGAVYTPAQQKKILYSAQSAYFAGMVSPGDYSVISLRDR